MAHDTTTHAADAGHHAHAPQSFFHKYLWSTDHKVIAMQYLFTGMAMGLIGAFMAYVFRMQLAFPGSSVPGWGVARGVQGCAFSQAIDSAGTFRNCKPDRKDFFALSAEISAVAQWRCPLPGTMRGRGRLIAERGRAWQRTQGTADTRGTVPTAILMRCSGSTWRSGLSSCTSSCSR